ncbi:hypothetical protein AVEN_155158-1, partial [Araneus ventricosus]
MDPPLLGATGRMRIPVGFRNALLSAFSGTVLQLRFGRYVLHSG